MIEDMLNVNTIFYISFVSLLFKMFKNGTLTEEQILMKKEKKITQLQNRKKKREDRIKTKIFRQNHDFHPDHQISGILLRIGK